jgi:TIR domain
VPGSIFISYRREDSQHAAGRLFDQLAQKFRRDQLFMDVDAIEPGIDFAEEINKKVAACDVLLAVIGPNWLKAGNEEGRRRIDDPNDFVRLEIEAALQRNVRVIPILVDAAVLPKVNELPESIQPLVRRNAVRIVHERFAAEASDLVAALQRAIASNDLGRQLSGWPGYLRPLLGVWLDAPAGVKREKQEEAKIEYGAQKESPKRPQSIEIVLTIVCAIVGMMSCSLPAYVKLGIDPSRFAAILSENSWFFFAVIGWMLCGAAAATVKDRLGILSAVFATTLVGIVISFTSLYLTTRYDYPLDLRPVDPRNPVLLGYELNMAYVMAFVTFVSFAGACFAIVNFAILKFHARLRRVRDQLPSAG